MWTRYGRVGLDGVGSPLACYSKEECVKLYTKKYNEKVGKGYTEVKMALGNSKAGGHVDVKMKNKKDA